MKHLKFLLIILSMIFITSNLFAVDSRDLLVKDYAVPVVIPKGKFEIDVDYLAINDTLDILNVRDTSINTSSAGSLGDLDGIQIMANWGILSSTMLHFKYSKSNIDYGFGTLKAKELEISFRYSFWDKIPDKKPLIAIDGGLRYDYADDLSSSNVSIMDRYVKKFFGPNYNVHKDNTGATIFEDKSKGWQFGVKNPVYVFIKDMKSYTGFLRGSIGKIYNDNLMSVLFLEIGKTSIDTRIDSDIKKYKAYKQYINYPLPVDLNRDETYLKLGTDFLVKFPHKIVWNFSYYYTRMFRNNNLDYIKYNHIIDTELNFYITKKFILNVGGKYMHRQFNGEVPYMYNKFTETTFDHKYGYMKVGFTVLF